MQSIQELFDKLQAVKKEQKEIKREYADTLSNTNEYEETTEEMKKLREKKKRIETIAQNRMGARYEKLEELKNTVDEINQMMTDVAMATLAEGKSIEIKDQYENPYEPVYKITFKRIS